MADLLLLPFQLGLLVVLHSVFALLRLVHVLSHLPLIFRQALFPLADPTTEPAPIDHDRKRWTKTPKHLAVILVPGIELRSWIWRSRADQDRRELARLQVELTKLVGWAKTLGLSSLSVYDREGLLANHANALAPALHVTPEPAVTRSQGCATFAVPTLPTRSRKLSEAPVNEVDSGHGGSDDVDARTATPPPDATGAKAATLTVHLLSREAGRPRMAQVVRELAEGRLRSIDSTTKGEVSVEAVGERMDALLPEPDLLLIQGGPYTRLSGYPPWQLRLTEISHHSSPAWLPAPPITYPILRNALDLYGGAEFRLGR